MNISVVSFGKGPVDFGPGFNQGSRYKTPRNIPDFNDEVSFSSTNKRYSKKYVDRVAKVSAMKGFLAGMAALTSVTAAGAGIGNAVNKPAYVTDVEFNSDITSIEDIAELYGVDVKAIEDYNDLDGKDVKLPEKVSVPSSFDYIQETIEKKTEAMYKKGYDPAKAEEIEALKRKQELQKQVADIYTDGKYAYIRIKDFTDNPELQERFGFRSLHVDAFKRLFDIEDGVLRKYNDNLDFFWGADSNGKGYKDYSNGRIYVDQTVRVPVKEIAKRGVRTADY